jgi:hypothetical protein
VGQRDLEGRLRGHVVERFEHRLADDPDYSFQAAAYHTGEPVLDVWGGPHPDGDSSWCPTRSPRTRSG